MLQCFDMLHRPSQLHNINTDDIDDDTLTCTVDAQEDEVEQILSTYLLNGYCLLEQACPACNVPLVKRPITTTTNNNDNDDDNVDPNTTSSIIPIVPLAGIAFCVKCHAHVVSNTTEFQLVQGYDALQKNKGSIYFLSESITLIESVTEESASKEMGTNHTESTFGTRSDGTPSVRSAPSSSAASTSSSSNVEEYDESVTGTTSYQLEEIEVVLARTEEDVDGDIVDDVVELPSVDHDNKSVGRNVKEEVDVEVKAEVPSATTNDYPEPPPTQRMSNLDPSNAQNNTKTVTSPKEGVELSLNEHHDNLLQHTRQNINQRHHHSSRYDPYVQLRTVDLDEIELKGCGGEEVSLLAIDETMMVHTNNNSNNHDDDEDITNRLEIEATKSHETAVDMAIIQQSASRNALNNNNNNSSNNNQTKLPKLVDFPMPEFNVRREIAIKVLAGKMVQGYSIMDSQCEACLMPLMCNAAAAAAAAASSSNSNNIITNSDLHCFVCRSIRKLYYKSLVTQVVANQCSKTDIEIVRNNRIQPNQVLQLPTTNVPDAAPNHRTNTDDFPVGTNVSSEMIVNHVANVLAHPDQTSTMFSDERDDTVTDGSDTYTQVSVPPRTGDATMVELNEDVHGPIELSNNNEFNDKEPSVTETSFNKAREMIRENDEVETQQARSATNVDTGTNTIEKIDDEASEMPNEEIENEGINMDEPVDDEFNTNDTHFECEECNEKLTLPIHDEYDPTTIDLVRKEMRNLSQQGWTLLDKPCPHCVLPLMTDECNTREICIHCKTMTDTTIAPGTLASSEQVSTDFPIDIATDDENNNHGGEIEEMQMSPLVSSSLFEVSNEMVDSSNVKTQTFTGSVDSCDVCTNDPMEMDVNNDVRSEEYVTDRDATHWTFSENPTDEETNISSVFDDTEETIYLNENINNEPTMEGTEKSFIFGIGKNTSNQDESEFIENHRTSKIEPIGIALETAIDAEKVFVEISESKSNDQPDTCLTPKTNSSEKTTGSTILGRRHWLAPKTNSSEKTTGSTMLGPLPWITPKTSSSEKSTKSLDPPASNNPVITDIFSRNTRRLGAPDGNRFRSNKSPEGFHRDARSCSPIRTKSPEIQVPDFCERIEHDERKDSCLNFPEQHDVGNVKNRVAPTNDKSLNVIHVDSPRHNDEWKDGVQKLDDAMLSVDTKILDDLETAQNFVRLEVPKTLSYTDRDAIVRLIEVATLTDGAKVNNNSIAERIGLRSASPGNSVANMPHSLSSTPSCASSTKSTSSYSHASKRSNNPPSPERHAVIDCTSPSNGFPKRVPSPGLSEAQHPRTISETSSVYSNARSRASRNSLPSRNSSEESNKVVRSRATPEAIIRSRKPGLPSYIPGNPNRQYFTGSRSYQQQSFPSESTAFSRTDTKNRLCPTPNQSSGSVKSVPLMRTSKLTSHTGTSWRERRDEVILVDDVETDARDIDIIDSDKLDALLRRIESTKSQLEHSDDAISQYRMRDLIVNLTRSAELLQQIEES